MADTEGKRLTELRVIDLKTELERRGLDKTGNKAALLERLSKVISEEGHNPEEFLIVPYVGPKVTPRKNSVTGLSNQDDSMDTSDVQKDENSEGQEAGEETAASEPVEEVAEPEVEEESKDEEKEEKMETEEVKEEKEDPDESKEDEEGAEEGEGEEEEASKETEVKAEETKEKESEKPKVQEVEKEKKEVPAVKETPQNVEVSAAAAAIESNGIDNEDSINLTIGEDEENLLAEEEAQDRQKDGGEKKRAQDSKKGDSKGSGRAEGGSSASNKDGTSGASIGTKSKDAGEGGKSGDTNSKGQKRDDKDKKSSQNSSNASSRNLWVSGLSSTTRATDLKQIFSKYGKVIGAKVVTNARTPGARCYGYVTMSTSDDASKCISHLHRTELHGRFISVEKAKGDSQQSHMRKRDSNGGKSEKPKDEKEKPKDNHHESIEKKESVEKKKESEEKEKDPNAKEPEENTEEVDEKKSEKEVEKKEEKDKDADARSTKSTSKKPESERGKRDEKRVRSFDRHRTHSRSRSRERRRRDDVLTFAKIREERDRQRLRERERLVREEERRRREDMERQREVERRQREEASRLEREREKLRRERERIEQEKAELLRLERERQKLEREKLERERLELKRQQMRLEESRRVPPPPSIKRTSSDRRDPRDLYVEPDRKRLTTEHGRRHSPERVPDRRTDILERVSDRRMDPSPPTRYDASRSAQDLGLKKDFKRGSEFSSRGSRPEAFTDVSRGREVIVRREPLPSQTPTIDPRQVKERYERPSATSYGRDRDVRRSEPDSHRSSRDTHGGRYDSSKPPGSNAPRDSRYVDNNRGPGGWHSGPPAKSFNSVPSGGARDPRNETSGWSGRSSDNVNRWGNSNSMGNTLRHPGPPMYQGGPMPSMGMSGPGAPASYDRFDPYKGSMPMRKY